MRGRPAVAVLLVVALGYLAIVLYRNTQIGPFQLFTFRVGEAFSAIDDREHEATKRRFVCVALEDVGSLCQLHGRRIKGLVRLFVDPKGRAAVVQLWPVEETESDAPPWVESPFIVDQARRIAAEWTHIAAPVTDHPVEGRDWEATSRWRTADRRWSATIQHSCSPTTPTVMEIADDAAVARAIAQNPNAAALLASAHLIAPAEEAENSEAPRRAPGECSPPKFARPTP